MKKYRFLSLCLVFFLVTGVFFAPKHNVFAQDLEQEGAPTAEATALDGDEMGETRPGQLVHIALNPIESDLRVALPEMLQSDGLSINNSAASTFILDYVPAGGSIEDIPCLTFPDSAKTSLNFAANGVWGKLLTSSVPIKIRACWADLPTGILGGAGPWDYYANRAGLPRSNTWYPAALANALAKTDVNGSDPEIVIFFAQRYAGSFYYGTDLATPSNKLNFATLSLHEIAHGLGFAGSMRMYSNGMVYWGDGTPYPDVYDHFTTDSVGRSLINTSVYPNGSAALKNVLTSNAVYFTGANAKAGNGATSVRLFAPSTWMNGSSYAHLDETFNNTSHALMTYSQSYGETIYDPGQITLGILKDLGWNALQNLNPTNIAISNNAIAENNALNAVIGTLTTTDITPGTTFTYSLVKTTACPGSDNSAFNINSNQLRASVSFNYEAKKSYNICIRTKNANNLTFDKAFTISITNVNELATEVFLAPNWTRPDQSAGSIVTTLRCNDPDIGDSLSYSLAAGEGDADNALFTINGNKLVANADLAPGVGGVYKLRINVKDASNGGATSAVTMTVLVPFDLYLPTLQN
jgi:hypothetical protein